jgi:beta-lactamase superfamily II metal-dependent hydrolase
MGGNKQQPFDKVFDQLMKDIEEDGVRKIDLVVATHRHQDHVSGFESPLWDDVEVLGEVWMPWTENYADEEAVGILMRQSKRAEKINKLLKGILKEPKRFGLEWPEQIAEVTEIKEFSENSLKNDEAMKTLHHGFKGGDNIRRRYLPHRDRSRNTIEPEFLPGVTVYIMGPSYDKDVISDMEPPAGEHWFRMMEDKGRTDRAPILPFHADWSKKPGEIPDAESILEEKDRRKIASVDQHTALNIARGVENAVNGTSLMMMFKIGKAFLFFPGDAQHGTWQSALKDNEWRQLLTKTNFYKVGHHGSHNATPKEFIKEVIQPKCRAMIPVYPVKIFEEIPKDTLLAEMTARQAEYVRSDKKLDSGDPSVFSRTDLYVDTKIDI